MRDARTIEGSVLPHAFATLTPDDGGTSLRLSQLSVSARGRVRGQVGCDGLARSPSKVKDMWASVVISAMVAVLVGFGGSVAIILASAGALGASPEQTSSWVAALCVSIMAITAILSIRHRCSGWLSRDDLAQTQVEHKKEVPSPLRRGRKIQRHLISSPH